MEEIGLDTKSLTSEQRQKTVFQFSVLSLFFGAALFLSEVSLVAVCSIYSLCVSLLKPLQALIAHLWSVAPTWCCFIWSMYE